MVAAGIVKPGESGVVKLGQQQPQTFFHACGVDVVGRVLACAGGVNRAPCLGERSSNPVNGKPRDAQSLSMAIPRRPWSCRLKRYRTW